MLVLKPLVTLVLFELPQIVAIFSRSESQPTASSLHFSYQYFFALTSQLAASLGTPSFHITHSIYRRRGSLGFSFWFSMGFPRIFYLTRGRRSVKQGRRSAIERFILRCTFVYWWCQINILNLLCKSPLPSRWIEYLRY